jgi:flagellar biosynthesis/type III secretory pathway M-ring protein FliF/YscJ
MNDTYQLASAALAFVFAAVILVVGQLYIQNRSERTLFKPAPRSVTNAIYSPVTRPDQQTIIKAR